MSYENATATKLLATHCVCCGRALVDAISVEVGMGPECRKGDNAGISEDTRIIANKITHKAAIAAQNGAIYTVHECAEELEALGLIELASKVASRFETKKKVEITIVEENGRLIVTTPFRRGAKEEFIEAWRKIPSRRYFNGKNSVAIEHKAQVFGLLKEFFAGKYGQGPKGIFRVPV